MNTKHFLLNSILAAMMVSMMLLAAFAFAAEKETEESTPMVICTELDYPPYSFLDESEGDEKKQPPDSHC